MSNTLPRLRMNLDFMSSPLADRPGLLIRDPYQYSDATLIIPPALVEMLQFFDGQSTDLDLRQALVRLTGDISVGQLETHLIESLSDAGFLENEVYEQLREARHSAFREAPVRLPAHSGTAYPDDAEEMRGWFTEEIGTTEPNGAPKGLIGIAAPHVSPEGGWESYRRAYRSLPADYKERIFVVLGTSHYGEADKFGLTRKPFRTPLGDSRTETSLVDWLTNQAPDAVIMEDYCHATEHSIEFQIALLQYVYGPDIRILPILCGPYASSIVEGGRPEVNDSVNRFLGSLGELHAKHENEIAWVLGVDMAHIGRRYGDQFSAQAYQAEMLDVSVRDKERIACIEAGDSSGFWDLVQENQDDLKWCGASPIYTFLKAVPSAKAHMLNYQHWQIDPQSVVSFAAMQFTA